MSEMIERVAEALKPFMAELPDAGLAARAAIEAMKNPPDYVLDAMNPDGRYASIVVDDAWNDAIDAALKPSR